MPEAARTLVKSPPELWAEVSDPASLARHLGAFGEIRITRLEPEVTVAWEGARARGTVDLEPAGWGTKVTLRAEELAPAETGSDAEPAVAPAGSATGAHTDQAPALPPAAGPSIPDAAEPSPRPAAAASVPPAATARSVPRPAAAGASVPPPAAGSSPDPADPLAVTAGEGAADELPASRHGVFRRLVSRLAGRPGAAPATPAPQAAGVQAPPEAADRTPAAGAEAPGAGPDDAAPPRAAHGTTPQPARSTAAPATAPAEEAPVDTAEVLDRMLRNLGSARHRPFSRG